MKICYDDRESWCARRYGHGAEKEFSEKPGADVLACPSTLNSHSYRNRKLYASAVVTPVSHKLLLFNLHTISFHFASFSINYLGP